MTPFTPPISPRAFRRIALAVLLVVIAVPIGYFAIGLAALLSITADRPFESTADRQRALTDALQTVIPAEFKEMNRDFGECDALKAHPDCIHAEFVDSSHSEQERVSIIEARAAAAGWAVPYTDPGKGGTELLFKRANFDLLVLVRSALVTDQCAASTRSDSNCADWFNLERH